MTSAQTLEKARYELVSALFINFKIEENTILRSTYDEILKPLALKEIKHFMLLLSQTRRNYRSTLELVQDVVTQIIQKRVDGQALRLETIALEEKFRAIMALASKQIVHSDYDTEIAFLSQAKVDQFKNAQGLPLFSPDERDVIDTVGFMTLIQLAMDDPYLFHQRVANALTSKRTNNLLAIAPVYTALPLNAPQIDE